MTDKEKAKAYDEALKRAKSVLLDCTTEERNVVEYLHPELKESEDERMMNQLHSWMKEFGGAEEYTEKVYQWIKGLLEKQGEQKPAWSEEDEKIYQSIMDDTVQENQLDSKQIDWLKSLKDRYTWKPSDEQMEALKSSTYCQNEQMSKVLFELYQDLKKLKE